MPILHCFSMNACEISANTYARGVSLLKRHGWKVGVRDTEIDWSLVKHTRDQSGEVSEETDKVLCDLVTSTDEQPQIEIDGKFVYKATVFKSIMNSSDDLSKDILKQIQGFDSTPTKICWEVCKWFDFSRRSNHHSTQSQSSCCSYSQVVYWQQPNTKYACLRSEWSFYIHYQTHSTHRNWWKLLWNGSFKDPKDINVLASNCMLVQTEVCLNHPQECQNFVLRNSW